MKTYDGNFIRACLTAGLITGLAAHGADAPADTSPASGKKSVKVIAAKTAAKVEAENTPPEEATILLNFRGASVQSVLNYIGDATGFTIALNQPVTGTIDVWNNHPLTKSEAVEVLNFALAKNGFAAIRKGRTLTIMTKEAALWENTPVKTSPNPEQIPNNSDIVTQIMPLAHVSASQLIRELTPILPSSATLVANEAGNSIIVTDTQANIHHLAEIVKAIDSSISSIAGIKVFPLMYADSKSVAAVLKELFTTDSAAASDRSGRTASPFAGFTGRLSGASGGGRTSEGAAAAPSAAKVTAVADDRSNSVIITAPDDVMPTIEELLASVDINVDDLTELKVFRLKFADPAEMAQLLTSLYTDGASTAASGSSRNGSSRSGSSSTGSSRTASTPSRTGATAAGGNQSERDKKQSQVIAVADPRTSSVVITTSHDLMRQIEQTIEKLDNDPSRKQKVYVYSLDSADPQQVQQVLQDLFQTQQSNTRNSRNTQTSPFVNRSNPTQTKSTRSTSTRIGN